VNRDFRQLGNLAPEPRNTRPLPGRCFEQGSRTTPHRRNSAGPAPCGDDLSLFRATESSAGSLAIRLRDRKNCPVDCGGKRIQQSVVRRYRADCVDDAGVYQDLSTSAAVLLSINALISASSRRAQVVHFSLNRTVIGVLSFRNHRGEVGCKITM
jgi:hypothetical protein